MRKEMRLDTSHSLPTLLMISDCLPNPDGGSRASRAWRLLCCAASTHTVSLSVQTDQPVNLGQWRRVAEIAHQVHIRSSRGSMLGSSHLLHGQALYTPDQCFDAVLLTSPRLWPSQDQVIAKLRLCDFSGALDGASRGAQKQPGLLERLASKLWLRPLDHVSRSFVAAECDRLLVAEAQQKDRLPKGRSRAVVIAEASGADAWTHMLKDIELKQAPKLTDYITPEVKVMPIQPLSSRKAA